MMNVMISMMNVDGQYDECDSMINVMASIVIVIVSLINVMVSMMNVDDQYDECCGQYDECRGQYDECSGQYDECGWSRRRKSVDGHLLLAMRWLMLYGHPACC